MEELNDLGVIRSQKLPIAGYKVSSIVAKANRIAGLILQAFRCRDRRVLRKAFSTYVLPILTYASPCWNPSLRRDVKAVKSVKKRFSKRLAGCHSLTYNQ